MTGGFPYQPRVTYAPAERRSVVVDRDDPTEVLQTLSSETAQEIVGVLRGEPRTASAIAEATGRSLQNVTYHLEQLCEADLVTPVETWYSEHGNEMTVYALATKRLVVHLGRDRAVE